MAVAVPAGPDCQAVVLTGFADKDEVDARGVGEYDEGTAPYGVAELEDAVLG